MASNEALKGIMTEKEISLDGGGSSGAATANSGYIQIADNSWPTAKAGPTSDTGRVDETIIIGASGAGGSGGAYVLRRSFLQFEIPFYPRVHRLDMAPQLKIRCSAKSGDGKMAITSCTNTYLTDPWVDGEANRDWDSVQTAVSAVYTQSAFETMAVGSNYTTITLNNLGLFHCISKQYILMCLMDYTHDFSDSAPGGSTTNNIEIHDNSDTHPPLLILRKPWFVDSQGNEYPVAEDFVIRASHPTVNQKNRRTAQLPFGSAIKGPAFLRQRNSLYSVTKS